MISLSAFSSFCSVDEEDDNILSPDRPGSRTSSQDNSQVRPSPPSKSRLSLNLVGKSAGSGASPKSSRKLTKFLRSSFSKLLQLSNNHDQGDHKLSPTSSLRHASPSIQSLNAEQVDSPDSSSDLIKNDPSLMTPTTLAYIEETKLNGLPVIPFAYPTCVLVDKQKYKDVILNSQKLMEKNSKKATAEQADETFEEFCNNQRDLEELTKSPPGTLESIVDIAQRQLREEASDDQALEMETDDYFFCGSVGSVSTLSEYNNNNQNNSRPRSRVVQASWDQAEAEAMFDLEAATVVKWHDYLDMTRSKYQTKAGSGAACQRRSEPIRIKDKQY